MKRSEAFPSSFLGKDDVLRPFHAVIKDVTLEQIKGEHGEEQKAVMHFTGNTKPMILNNTNWLIIEASYGDETESWKGRPVEIYVDPNVMFGTKRVGGVRLRIPLTSGIAPNTPVPVWTLDQAVQACVAAGITREELIQEVKDRGHAGWNAARDTPAIQAMIAKKQSADESFAEAGAEIPF